MPRGRSSSTSRGNSRSRSSNSRPRCSVHKSFLNADGNCARCPQIQVEVPASEVTIENNQTDDNTNNYSDVPQDEMTTVDMCGKCCRTSTDEYQLNFQFLSRESLRRTTFGKHLIDTQDTVKLCQNCVRYNDNPDRSEDWLNAWPSVFYTLLFETHRFNSNATTFYRLLPWQIKNSFKHCMNTVNPVLVNTVSDSFLRDISADKAEFWSLINTRTAKSLVEALTKFCFPYVRCPAGCFEFVEKTHSVAFAHFLNYLYPLFTSFHANSKKFLKGARKDFLKPLTLLQCFKVTPCIITNENGIQLVTCSDHSKGLPLKYVHVPTNPVAGNISPKFADRLALLVSSVRTVRPLRIGVKSATFTMCRVDSGRISGVSSTVLHNFRNFEVPYTTNLKKIEALLVTSRNDITDLLRTCCQNEQISRSLTESILNFSSPVSVDSVEAHCKEAVVFNMSNLMRFKDYVESCPEDLTSVDEYKKPLILPHKLDGYGCEPCSLPRTIAEDSNLFPFIFAFLYTDLLWSKIVSISREHHSLVDICKHLHRVRENKYLNKNVTTPAIVTGLRNSFINLFDTEIDPLNELCERMTGCLVVHCHRMELNNLSVDCSRNEVVLVVANETTGGRDTQIPFQITSIHATTFELTFIASDMQLSLRYGDPFFNFWTIKNNGSRAFKDATLEYQYNRNWKFLMYVSKKDLQQETKLRYLAYMGGQGVFFCQQHNLPLSTDYMNSRRKCSLPKEGSAGIICTRRSAWRCPDRGCVASVCKKHFTQLSEHNDQVFVLNRAVDSDINDSSDEDVSDNLENIFTNQNPSPEDQIENMEEFDGPNLILDAGFQDRDNFSTDSGCEPVYVSNDSKFVPMHVLLNGECKLMKRLKYPNHVGKKFQRFLQNFVSTIPGRSVPLLQPEACLFPSIFYKQLADGSFPGALPFFLYDDRNKNSKLDFEGLHEHLKLRLKDGSLLTSSNLAYIMYAFDCVLNLSLTKCHTNQFFKRGLQSISVGKYKPQQLTSTESVLKMDSVDSDIHVNRLGTACASETPDLFVTFTCNQSEHPGVAPLVNAIHSMYGNDSKSELKDALQSYMVIIVRCWTRTIELLLDYLRFSEEHILGEIVKVWGRAEFQSAAANLQHYHFLLWIKNIGEELDKKIQCAHKHVFHEFKKLFNCHFGTVESLEHAGKLTDDCIRVQTHDCEKGNRRCMKKTDIHGNKICRFPPYPTSHGIWYKEFHQPHSKEALQALQCLNLAEPRLGYTDELQVTTTLRAGKYMYAASAGEHMSPLNVPLWSIVKSSLNVLKVCKSVASRYLTSYAAGKEEHADVNINPDNSSNRLNIRVENVQNKKIGGVRKILSRETKNQKNQGVIDSTTIASTECVSWMLDLPSVITTMDFVSVPSVPLENRGGVILKRKNRTIANANRPGITNEGAAVIRENMTNLPNHRLFTRSQKTVLDSLSKTPFSTDKVTVFSVRPPELLFVDSLRMYFRCFVREKLPCKKGENVNVKFLKLNISDSHWIDGENNAVRLRPSAVSEFSDFVQQLSLDDPADCKLRDASIVLAQVLQHPSHPNRANFVSRDTQLSNTPAEVVFSKVYPRNASNFLIHFLLSNGRFETELDLFDVPSLKLAYVKGKLVENKQVFNDDDVNAILKQYILQELRFLPGGTRSFDCNLLAAKSAFKGLLIDNDIYNEALPETTMDKLTEAMEDKLKKALRQSQVNIIKALGQKNLPNFPTSDDFEAVSKETPSNWIGDILPNGFQSNESFQEQCEILTTLKTYINECLFVDQKFRKHQLILGPPGTGKTYVLTMALGYALSKGLFCLVTSLASRRSMHFGGEHIHKLFCLPPSSNGSPLKMAEQALNKLDFRNDKKVLLLAVEVLFVEDVSLISAEQWCAMDIILQELRQSNLPFAGILVIASGDQMQLPAIDGNDIFLSPVLLTNFALFFLSNFVRMTDAAGQKVLREMWKRPIEAGAVEEILRILGEKCTFKDSWNDLDDPSVMRVFGKRKAEQKEFESHIQRVRSSGNEFKIFEATDEICLSKSSVWNETSSTQVSNYLNDKVNEPKQLIIYPKALVRVTVNLESEQLSQGQVGVVHEVPTGDSVTVYIPDSSGGEVNITSEMLQQEQYLAWRTVTLSKQQGFVQSFKKNSVRRTQIPLMNFVAMTVHKMMGDTFIKLATSISATDSSYALWMTSQVFVIISRVKELKNLVFVGNKRSTLNAIRTLFEERDLREEHLFSLMDKIRSNGTSSTVQPVNISRMSFIPFNKDIPQTPFGFVYLLLSVNPQSVDTFYVGQTKRALLTRLSEHNSGNGSGFTAAPHRLPWAVAAFVCNFDSDSSRRDLEAELHRSMFERRNNLKTLNNMLALFQEKVDEKNINLHFCVCGRFGNL